MYRIPLVIKYVDGREQKVIVTAPDVLAFERTFDQPTNAIFTTGRLEYLWWAAWHAAKRATPDLPEFDPWVETIGNVEDDETTVQDLAPLGTSQPTG